MEQQTSRSRISELINQAIALDLQEIGYWKKTADRNTKFAQNNVKQATESLSYLIELKKIFNP